MVIDLGLNFRSGRMKFLLKIGAPVVQTSEPCFVFDATTVGGEFQKVFHVKDVDTVIPLYGASLLTIYNIARAVIGLGSEGQTKFWDNDAAIRKMLVDHGVHQSNVRLYNLFNSTEESRSHRNCVSVNIKYFDEFGIQHAVDVFVKE